MARDRGRKRDGEIMAGRGVYGGSRLRKKLRFMPAEVTAELKQVIAAEAAQVLDAIKDAAPVDKGNLRREANFKLSNDGLGASIGYSQGPGFKKNWKKGGFEAIFEEFGTKHA